MVCSLFCAITMQPPAATCIILPRISSFPLRHMGRTQRVSKPLACTKSTQGEIWVSLLQLSATQLQLSASHSCFDTMFTQIALSLSLIHI